jgi:hypothetical protein
MSLYIGIAELGNIVTSDLTALDKLPSRVNSTELFRSFSVPILLTAGGNMHYY